MAVDLHHDEGLAWSELGRFAKADFAGADGVQLIDLLAHDKLKLNTGRMTVTGRI